MCLSALPMLAPSASALPIDGVTVCIGDSITEGASSSMGAYVLPQHTYPAQLALLTDWTVINAGIRGEHTSHMLARFQEDVLALSPARVIIMGGTNDIYAGVSAATVKQNLEAMINLATDADATVYLLCIIPRNVFTPEMQIAADEVNAWIMAQGSSSVVPVDTYTALEAPSTPDKLNFGLDIDGTHPNAIGMRAIVVEILKAANYPLARWTGAGADALASNPDNWVSSTVPNVSSVVVFDNGSAPCTWDISEVYSLNSFGYTGKITQGDIDWTTGVGGLYMITGTIQGNLDRHIRSDGTCGIASPALFTSNTANLIMAGDLLRHAGTLQSITFVSSCEWARGSTNSVTINEGVIVRSTGAAYIKYVYMLAGSVWDNRGSIIGDAGVTFGFSTNDQVMEFGDIQTPITFRRGGSSTSSRTVSLASDTVLGSITIESTHATATMTLDLGVHTLRASDITVAAKGILAGSEGTIYISAWDSTAGSWIADNSTVVLRDGGSAVLAPGQSFNRLEIASDDGRTASWNMTATGTVSPVVTGLGSGSYLWYLDGVEQGEVRASSDSTIELSYQSTGLHSLEVKPTQMTIAMDGVYAIIPVVLVLSVLGGLVAMVGRVRY